MLLGKRCVLLGKICDTGAQYFSIRTPLLPGYQLKVSLSTLMAMSKR